MKFIFKRFGTKSLFVFIKIPITYINGRILKRIWTELEKNQSQVLKIFFVCAFLFCI